MEKVGEKKELQIVRIKDVSIKQDEKTSCESNISSNK